MFEYQGPRRLTEVHMLMRVEMGRVGRHQLTKTFKLSIDFGSDGVSVVERHNRVDGPPFVFLVRPLTQIEVEADAEAGQLPRASACVFGSVASDHQARTGDNPCLVTFDDAAVDARAKAEIIRVHNQATAHQR
jgi:hypothetical protein